ncbi:MAG: type II CRISPR-associated endonuclease Cas1 [Bacteroidetes bacterium]|nr:type II CRISPR-associated endonuclease Cas1 [Bacteroidota bacterium]
MLKRTIYIGNPFTLRLRFNQLEFFDELKNTNKAPVEDIGILILDHPQVCVTHGIVNALLENGVAILWCDSRHLPNGLLLPLENHHIHTAILRHQMDSSEPLRKQIWKQIVQSKIANQAAILDWSQADSVPLRVLIAEVQSGDAGNHEGRAAALYWKLLFQDKGPFQRYRYGPSPNHLLNYGYAVLRAVVARSLVGSGLHPALGLHHHNKYNPYCLADDIMEPFRPAVDKLVLSIIEDYGNDLPDELTKEIKQSLLTIPVLDVIIGKELSPLMNAAQRMTASLVQCYNGETRKLLCPEMVLGS